MQIGDYTPFLQIAKPIKSTRSSQSHLRDVVFGSAKIMATNYSECFIHLQVVDEHERKYHMQINYTPSL